MLFQAFSYFPDNQPEMYSIIQGFAESLQQNLEDPRPKTLPYLEE